VTATLSPIFRHRNLWNCCRPAACCRL